MREGWEVARREEGAPIAIGAEANAKYWTARLRPDSYRDERSPKRNRRLIKYILTDTILMSILV